VTCSRLLLRKPQLEVKPPQSAAPIRTARPDLGQATGFRAFFAITHD